MKKQSAYHFMLAHAGYSYSDGERPIDGRRRCASIAARAEQTAHAQGYSFEWRPDGRESSEWSDEAQTWPTWECLMRSPDGRIVNSLSGIDFGSNSEPWGNPYKRVVEADLAVSELRMDLVDLSARAK